jgi:hypothetical protein
MILLVSGIVCNINIVCSDSKKNDILYQSLLKLFEVVLCSSCPVARYETRYDR